MLTTSSKNALKQNPCPIWTREATARDLCASSMSITHQDQVTHPMPASHPSRPPPRPLPPLPSDLHEPAARPRYPQVHSAEQSAPPPLSLGRSRRRQCGRSSRTPSIFTQSKVLSGRALLNVARDPYLATLHLLLTPVIGVVVGSLFGDLRHLNSETAGIQVGALHYTVLYIVYI